MKEEAIFKIGQKVRIVADTSMHECKIGSIITIDNITTTISSREDNGKINYWATPGMEISGHEGFAYFFYKECLQAIDIQIPAF